MARGAQNQAKQNFKNSQQTFGQAQNTANTASSNANSLYGQLVPTFQGMATNPQGYGAGNLAKMNTAAQQSEGGSVAGAVGQGNLTAARTRNAGGYAPALDEAVRSGQRDLSSKALGVEGANADLQEKQREIGTAGLGGLYNTNSNTLLQAMGIQNGATNAGTGATNSLTDAGKSGWFQNMLGMINALKPSGSSANGGSIGFGG